MKRFILAVLLLASSVANAAFEGDYDVSNWTQDLNGGLIYTSAAPTLISMVSSDTDSGMAFTDFTIAAVGSGRVSFSWAFLNGDIDGSGLDPFGYLFNNSFTQLTVDDNFGAQSGSASFMVSAGDVFGFRLASSDSALGPSFASIRDFDVAPVPEPETYAMMLAGLGLVGAMARKRRAV